MTATTMWPDVTPTISPTATPVDRSAAIERARIAYERFADEVAQLAHDDWGRPTDCDGWTVRDLVGHVVGAMRSAASARELVAQSVVIKRRARRTGESETDAMTAVQIERTAHLSSSELVSACRSLAGPAAAGRRRIPVVVRRRVRIPVEIGSISERWPVGYLVDVILTRDAWLHRIDLCRAVGREPVLSAGHDGVLVADVVREWSVRHGRPYRLVLTGPAGGVFAGGEHGACDEIQLDAIEFCRIVSGRARGDGLLATEVPF